MTLGFDWRLVLVLLAWLFGLFGCASPRTVITAGPLGSNFRIHNSKDVTVSLENAKYDPTTKALEIGKLEITDNASAVRLANVEQIRAGYEGAVALFPAMVDSIVKAMPSVLSAYGGISATAVGNDSGIRKIIEDAIAAEVARRTGITVTPAPAP